MAKIYTRWQKQKIIEAIKTRRVLLLTGSRQCGKTTLAKELATENTLYRTLDDPTLKAFASSDPIGFVQSENQMLIIDEVQRVPDLLPAIKLVVDEDNRPGQFLLTGSANITSLPSVQESLAGRIRKIRLRPFTQGELLESQPVFLEKAFNKVFAENKKTYSRRQILEVAFRGGFPEAVRLAPKDRPHWHKDYINALLDRDLADIMRITQHHSMRELIHILAAWSGKFMDISAIGAGLSIRRPTIESYINALENLYLIDRVRPWTSTDYERVGKQAKLYFADSGLMSSLLRWNIDQVELDADRMGKLFETFIYNELATQIDCSDNYEMFHYRDREKREIDFIIQRDDQALLGIEVKAASRISEADFKHLRWFKDNIVKDQDFIGIVLYTGEHVGSMGENLWAVPFSSLWIG